MSIYQALNCQEDVGNADILSGSYTLVDSLERLRAMPMESLPRCDYSLDFDDAGELDSEEVTKSICSSDVISRLSELCSLEPESLPNGGYDEPPIFPCMYSLCNQASECLSDGRYREKDGVPVPKLLLPCINSKEKTHEPPDITDGLGKRQESRDLVSLEDFVVRHAEWLIFENCLCIYRKPCWVKLSSEKDAIREIRRIFQPYPDIRESLTARDYKALYNGLLSNPSVETLDVLDSPENCINCLDGV